MNERPWTLPGVTCAVVQAGDFVRLTLPKGTVTAIEVPQSGIQDGTADYLATLRRDQSSIRHVVLGCRHALFGLGNLSNGAIRALVFETSRQLNSSPERVLPLLVGTRDALVPIGEVVDRLTTCQPTDTLPPGWLGGTMPFMTPLGLLTMGHISLGTLRVGTNRAIYLTTTAQVAPTVLQTLAQRLAQPFFGWFEALGVRTSADALVLSATGTSDKVNIQTMVDPLAFMLQTAFALWVEKTIVAWGRAMGLKAIVRIEGALDEEELTRVVRSVTAAGRWVGALQSAVALRGVMLEAVRNAALVNDTEGERWLAVGDEQLTRQTQGTHALEAFRNGVSRLTIHLGRGAFSTTFVV